MMEWFYFIVRLRPASRDGRSDRPTISLGGFVSVRMVCCLNLNFFVRATDFFGHQRYFNVGRGTAHRIGPPGHQQQGITSLCYEP